MTYTKEFLPYQDTNSYSKLVLDYIAADKKVESFYHLRPSKENIVLAIKEKSLENTDRATLVKVIKEGYENCTISTAVQKNLENLLLPNTFTICTAHQPNIFTGHLYFIYKILHAIQLAETLKKELTAYHFVPVFYMGTEDADLEELGHINWNGEKITWQTNQKGAVGRMVIDDAFIALIQKLEGTFGSTQSGIEMMQMVKDAYKKDQTIQESTLQFVNHLFGKYGLLILIADDARLKEKMIPVFKSEIINQSSNNIVALTSAQLAVHYKEQAFSRAINLFYLSENSRERIEKKENGNYFVLNTNLEFTEEEMIREIEAHPENFSPNVILRGLFQETILPNIAFIGGGGELAYWLQLKTLFEHYHILFPILILRNSFLIQTKKQQETILNLGFSTTEIFSTIFDLENNFTFRNSSHVLNTNSEKENIATLYNTIAEKATVIDPTLTKHIDALKTKQINKLFALDKKILRAEKRNFADGIIKINKLKQQLFPKNNLQERVDNIIPYYAKYGNSILDTLLESSQTLESNFCVLTVS